MRHMLLQPDQVLKVVFGCDACVIPEALGRAPMVVVSVSIEKSEIAALGVSICGNFQPKAIGAGIDARIVWDLKETVIDA